MSNELNLLAVVAKKIADLQRNFTTLSKQSGPSGKDGLDGADGRHGIDGRNGADGIQGADGKRGPRGPKGEQGEQGEVGPAPDHQWQGDKLRFQKPDGGWGKWVALKGEKGDKGAPGRSGNSVGIVSSGNSWSPDELPVAASALPDEFVVKQDGQWFRASFAQMQSWLGVSDPSSPQFTYVGGRMSRIDYADSSFKVFAYTGGGALDYIDFTQSGTTTRKTFVRDVDGVLTEIVESTQP